MQCLQCRKVIVKASVESWARFRDRKFCSKRCSNILAAERSRTRRHEDRQAQLQRRANRAISWPFVTGEIETSFHGHDHDPGDVYGSVGLPSATLVPRGSSADL